MDWFAVRAPVVPTNSRVFEGCLHMYKLEPMGSLPSEAPQATHNHYLGEKPLTYFL